MTMARVFVAAGSNLHPRANMRAALCALAKHTPLVAISTVYRTKPEGRPDQPDFYNCVVEIRTETKPSVLKFQVLRQIEADLGRQRSSDKYAARTIDLDLILYGDLVMETSDLVLPDPDIVLRSFLAIALSELAPDLRLPGTNRRLREIAADFPFDKLHPLRAYTRRLREDIT